MKIAGASRQLTAAEHRQRVDAAHHHRRGETAPSIRQGSTGAPSRSAIAMFRQGQARPDTRARRGPWDTRSTEAPIGAMNATVKLHFPKAVRSKPPAIEPPHKGRPFLAMALAPKKDGGHQDVRITNPGELAEAHRHPLMRDIMQSTVGVVREHQKGTIERAHARNLIPEGTHPGAVGRAYKHAALLAIHRAGMIDYDFHMDDHAKRELRPLVPFMRYAHRRVFDRLNVANKGRYEPFKGEFGHEFRSKKHGKETGAVRQRMRPNNEFVKIDLDAEDLLTKDWTNDTGVIHAPGSPTNPSPWSGPQVNNRRLRAPGQVATDTSFGRIPPNMWNGQSQNMQQGDAGSRSVFGLPAAQTGNENGHDTHTQAAQLAHVALRGKGKGKPGHVPEPAQGVPAIGDAHTRMHIGAVAQQVEDHLGVPRIGGRAVRMESGLYRIATDDELQKMDFGFTLGEPDPMPRIGDYNTNPRTQLHRAIQPRMRRRAFRLRLNTQKDLRRVLSGGITRQERWQLGATTRVAPFKLENFGKMEKAVPGLRSLRAVGQHLHDLVTRPTAIGKKPSFVHIKRDLLRANMRGKERFLATDLKGHVVARVTGGRSNVKVPDRLMHTSIGRTYHNHPGDDLGIPSVADHDVAHKLGGSRHTIVAPQDRAIAHFEQESGNIRTPKTRTLRYRNPVGRLEAAGTLDRLRSLGKRLLTEADVRAAAGNAAALPSLAQARAGNYRKGHIRIGGLDITIETPRGTMRSGGAPGREWKSRMPAHYGYIKRTEGADGDHVDVYLGPHAHQAPTLPVFIVDQQHADSGKFDEHKALLGFRDEDAAVRCYDRAFSDGRGPDRRRTVHTISFDDFRDWLDDGDTTRAFKLTKLERVTKARAHYTSDGKPQRHCSLCVMFDKPNHCTKVDGEISPAGMCEFFYLRGRLQKGVVGDAIRYGAEYLSPMAHAAAKTEAVSRMFGRGVDRFGNTRVAGAIGGASRRLASSSRVARVAAHPRIAPAIAQARDVSWRGLLAPAHAIGSIGGAAIGGSKGAKIGGGIGLAADYAPDVYAASAAGKALFGGKKQKKPQPLPGTLTQQAEGKILGKSLIGTTGRAAAMGLRAATRGYARAPTTAKVGAGIAAGLALPKVKDYAETHPGARAIAGGAAAGTVAALLTRGRAIGAVRRTSRAIYTTSLKNMVRQHLQTLAGGAPSPHHVAQQRAVMRGIRAHALNRARAARTAGLAGIRPAKRTIAAAAAGGAALGFGPGRQNNWTDLQHPENP